MKQLALFLAFAALVGAEQKKVVTLEIGASAPAFELPGVDGKTYSLDSFADASALALIFTCNHCPDAISAWSRIQLIADEYRDKGVAVVAISGNDPQALYLAEYRYAVYGDSFDEMKDFAEEYKLNYPYLYDGELQEASLAYGAVATPHAFVFDKERKLQYQGRLDDMRRKEGRAKNSHIRKALDAVLAGEEVENKTTKVHGCSTKWSWKREMAQKRDAKWKTLPVTMEEIDAAGVTSLVKNSEKNLRLINVWSTTCGPCLAEFPDLVDTYRRYDMRHFEFYSISTDEAERAENALAFLKKEHSALSPHKKEAAAAAGFTTNNFRYSSDDLDALVDALDSEWQGPIPHTVLVAPGGKILWRHTGQVEPVELRRTIVAALSGKLK